MRTFRYLFFLLLIISFSTNSFTQNITQTIRGKVQDKITGTPLIGASVIIPDSDPLLGNTTDIEGNFKIEKVPVGKINLKITYIGYSDITLSNITLNSGKELVLEINMDEKVITGKTVEIKANSDKSVINNKMATVSARSFNVDETERYAGSLNDVSRMASNFAGVGGSNDSRNDIIIRGNSPSGLLWRLEGVDIPNPNHYAAFGTTGGPVSMLNNTLLSNSDFMTGAFPAEYGNAISGVFDLKMRNGNNEKHEFLGQIGFNGLELGAEGPVSKKNASSYLINYRYSTLSVFEMMGMDFGTTGVPFYQDVSFKMSFPKTTIGSISIFGLGGKSDIEIFDSRKDTTEDKLNLYGGEGFDITNGSDVAVLGLTQTYLINNTTYTRLTVSASYHNFTTLIDSLTPVTFAKSPWYRNNFTEEKLFASFFLNKKINSKHNYKAGFMVSDLFFNLVDSVFLSSDSAFRTITDFDGSTFLIQPYIQWQYKLSDEIIFNAGIHLVFFTLNSTYSIEPRLGFKWAFAPSQSLNIGFGQHSQTLPITVYFNQVKAPDGSYARVNENIGLIHSRHFVLGYDLLMNEFTRIKAETYYQQIYNAAVNAAASDEFSILNQGANFGVWTPDTLVAKGKGFNYGFEFTLERFLNKGFYFLLTSSLFESKYKGSDEILRSTAFNGNYIFNALAGKEFTLKSKKGKCQKSIAVDVKTIYAGGQRYTPSTVALDPATGYTQYKIYYEWDKAYTLKYSDYARSDLKIVFRRNGKKTTQEWGVNITNLFNRKNIFNESFNKKTGEKGFNYQTGRLIIPQYRIIF
jgi:hypothetical protein